jgi:hypothetical protein
VKELFLGGRVIDWIVALVALEALALLGWRHIFARGPAPLPLISNLLAGAFLLLALRNSLAGASAGWVALCLIAALVAHLADLRLRWDPAEPKPLQKLQAAKIKATIFLRVPTSVVRPAVRSQKDDASHG